ncbi:MAG: MFS transporter [Hyphomonadaceae bacterium]|nr:MFS transporter [Hyphomonadaceae bacterium]
MKAVLSSVGALLISAAILLAGGGLMSTLIAVRAQIEGFPVEAIGFMTSAYFAGFIAGCFATPYLVKRVGHVRVFAALSSIIAAATLTHAIFVNVPIWILLRVLAGFSFAGLYMLIESWINEQAPNEKRGQVLSLYRMVDLGAVTAGQFMLTLSDPSNFVLFSLVAILICIAIFPISLSAAKAPIAVTQTSLNLRKLINTSPLAVAGAFAVGMANGAFWGVAPVFVQQLGHPIIMVSTFMSVTIFSGAILQWPAGYLSDKIGRRIVLILASIGAAGAGVFLWQFGPVSQSMLLIGAALYGVFAMQVFGMSAAHANDFAEPHEFVAISGGLLLIYGIGSVIGPSTAPFVMSQYGPSALFAYTACVHALLCIYAVMRVVIRRVPDQTGDYVSIPRPRALNLILRSDPRIMLKRKK